MTLLFAQPYDIAASGFYFGDFETYRDLAAKAVNRYGEPVEEFEIQFIDGDDLDCALADAFGLNQANLKLFFGTVEEAEMFDKLKIVIAVRDCGYDLDPVLSNPDSVDIDILHVSSIRELAEQFVDEGVFGPIPETLQNYIDIHAIARDLEMDISEVTIVGETYVYRRG